MICSLRLFLFLSFVLCSVNKLREIFKYHLKSIPEYLQSYINEHEPILKKCHKMMRQEKCFNVGFLVSLIALIVKLCD